MPTRDHPFTLLTSSGRRLLTGLTRRAGVTLARWVRDRRDEGESDDEIQRRLRSEGFATQAHGTTVASTQSAAKVLERPEPYADLALEEGIDTLVSHEAPIVPEDDAGDDLPDDILDGTIDDLVDSLLSGRHDDHLDQLLEDEVRRKGRKGARAAILERRETLAALDILGGTLEDLDRFLSIDGADRYAEAMLAAEQAGKQRKGAIERLEKLAA